MASRLFLQKREKRHLPRDDDTESLFVAVSRQNAVVYVEVTFNLLIKESDTASDFRLTLVLSCAMKFESYPHDTQICSMMIESCKVPDVALNRS